VCAQCVTNVVNAKFKEHKYFVNKVETQLREKPLFLNEDSGKYGIPDKMATLQNNDFIK
jgi:hypothetical protein